MTSPDRAAFVYIGAFVDELARAGLRHVCIAPGSRSAPLALTIAAHPRLKIWMHLDERSAGFFALGMARALGEPVALLCTSGTAAANFLPSVVEANRAGVPLLVLTADRPPELRDVDAAQTIDQTRLYGHHVKWFVDVALPDIAPDLLRYVRTLAGRAHAAAAAVPSGPVHLNFPFREPLVPIPVDAPAGISVDDALAWHGRPNGAPWVAVYEPTLGVEPAIAARLARELAVAARPLIVCGPQYDPLLAESLGALSVTIGAPLLADPLSQLRWGKHDRSAVIDRYDAFLRSEPAATRLAPDLVVRIGAPPTSKTLLQYLQRHGEARHIVVDPAHWPDPLLTAAEVIHADPRMLVISVNECSERSERHSNRAWLDEWRAADRRAGSSLADYASSRQEIFEGAVLAEAVQLLPDNATLFVSSSMPVRDLDSFSPGDGRSLRTFANRGANGIDGVVSTALGVAATREKSGGALVLVIGDIAFYHDMNGLLAAKRHGLDATIVVINNDGGGIFSFLQQAGNESRFEELFGTPHGLDFAAAATLYGADYVLAKSIAELRAGLIAGIGGQGLHIVEVRTDRTTNVTLHRDAWAEVARALETA